MKRTNDLAKLIVSCWSLSEGDATIPTSQGVLDRAMRDAVEEEAFPLWARDNLHFVDGRIGLRCIELGVIVERAQEHLLTSVPNPSYQETVIKVSPLAARHFLRRLGVSEPEAKTWGQMLRAAVARAKTELGNYDTLGIEDY